MNSIFRVLLISLPIFLFQVCVAGSQGTSELSDDEILRRLNDQLRGASAADRVVTTEDGVKTETVEDNTVYSNINFDINSSILRSSELSKVIRMCRIIDKIEANFLVLGHTDASGSSSANKALSKARAQSVMDFLTDECEFEEARFYAVGLGEDDLLEDLPPNDGRHRRVEFQVMN